MKFKAEVKLQVRVDNSQNDVLCHTEYKLQSRVKQVRNCSLPHLGIQSQVGAESKHEIRGCDEIN